MNVAILWRARSGAFFAFYLRFDREARREGVQQSFNLVGYRREEQKLCTRVIDDAATSHLKC